jgi:hypothetical protein
VGSTSICTKADRYLTCTVKVEKFNNMGIILPYYNNYNNNAWIVRKILEEYTPNLIMFSIGNLSKSACPYLDMSHAVSGHTFC